MQPTPTSAIRPANVQFAGTAVFVGDSDVAETPLPSDRDDGVMFTQDQGSAVPRRAADIVDEPLLQRNRFHPRR
jgi:hypothetical protein